MSDLAVNLLASAIAGLAVWLSQLLVRRRKRARVEGFFGLQAGSSALLIVSKQARSEWATAIEKADVSAMVELAVLLKSCDVTPRFYMHHEDVPGIGDEVEFCIGGPMSNQRTAAHLRWHMPGVTQGTFEEGPEGLTIQVGEKAFQRVRGEVEYALVARILIDRAKRPIFLIFGQTALANEAAARYLVREKAVLSRTYGNAGNFCFVLGLFGREVYGSHFVRLVDDITGLAFDGPAKPGGLTGGEAARGRARLGLADQRQPCHGPVTLAVSRCCSPWSAASRRPAAPGSRARRPRSRPPGRGTRSAGWRCCRSGTCRGRCW